MKPLFAAVVTSILGLLGATDARAATGTNTGKLTTLLWYEGHDGLLIRQVGMTDLGGCGRSDYFILDSQHLFFKEIYTMLLSAQLSSLPVQITVTDCVQGISRVRHVQMAASP